MKVYVIFAFVGWAWAVVAGVFLLIRMRRKPSRGFDVIHQDEK